MTDQSAEELHAELEAARELIVQLERPRTSVFREIFERAATGIALIDSRTGRFLKINRRYCELVGYTQEEMEGFTFQDITHPTDLQEDLDNMALLRSGELQRFSMEKRYLQKGGSTVWVNLAVSPMWEPGDEPTTHVAVVKDISQRKSAELDLARSQAQLLHLQKLESLGALAGGIAHDFNNLLSAILLSVDLARESLPEGSPSCASLTVAQQSARKATELTQQMLAYAGKGEFAFQRMNLNAVVEGARKLIGASISKTVSQVFDFSDDLPGVEADPSQIEQAIMNLVLNAAEAIGEGTGEITITTRAKVYDPPALGGAELAGLVAGDTYVSLSVSDTGCGMTEDVRARVFEPFFSTKFVGRGLGLAAIQGIVRSHKGRVAVESELGRGTTFTVYLPAVSEPVSSASDSGEPVADSDVPKTILLVDDEESLVAITTDALRLLGYSVLVARDGVEAVEVFRKHSETISCVLLDLTMPRMGGAEAFVELQKIRAETPVILSSGYTEQESIKSFNGQTLAGFIAKPYSLSELRAKLQMVLETR
jgi:two-component system, cell cycle sensor histidine kinase and response regulator CckA